MQSRPPAGQRKDGSIKHFPLDAFNFVIQVNLVGTFRCIAKSAAGMLTLDPLEDGDRGAMVNTASVAAEDGPNWTGSLFCIQRWCCWHDICRLLAILPAKVSA